MGNDSDVIVEEDPIPKKKRRHTEFNGGTKLLQIISYPFLNFHLQHQQPHLLKPMDIGIQLIHQH